MKNEKIKFSIEMNLDTYSRLKDVVQYYNLFDKFYNVDGEVLTEHDLIIGAIKEILDKFETFSDSKLNSDLTPKKNKPLKNNIKTYLKKRNIKQIELAQALGIDKGALTMYLNNYKQPPIDLFMDILAVLQYPSLDEILYREEENPL